MVLESMKSNPKTKNQKRVIQEQIFANLKEVFDDYSQDGLPQEMQDMVRLLRAQDIAKAEKNNDE